ncbi:tetratricopeptide repeat protein [Pseudomonas sp. NW5]|uniref:tetratricopeptide repeat protein n=1 Tax=Pseudomonas sp. NW5 TaxID=2934934 RepID=UPI0020217C15|nr:tetratricopeptide repeat protein [Pseudomonas sp. NW5]MCL7461224.1 tetratricopeptide repeat protein [Pseudomonas sp. NW5]
MYRIAMLAVAITVLGGCQSGGGVANTRSNLYDGDRSVLYEVGKKGGSADQAMAMAAAAYRAGDRDQALFQYLRASELDPKRAEALIWVARIHRERSNYALARMALDDVLERDPQQLAALSELGTLQIAQRQYEQATETLMQALRVDQQRLKTPAEEPPRVDDRSPMRLYNGLGVLADLRNDFSTAERYYRLALQVSPQSALAANSLGYSRYLAGDWEGAYQAYRQALGADAAYKPAWRNYGLLLARMGRYEEALSAFEQVGARAEASNDVGYVCLIEGKLSEAERFFRAAIDLAPAHYEVAAQNLRRVQQVRNLRSRGGDARTLQGPLVSVPAAEAGLLPVRQPQP